MDIAGLLKNRITFIIGSRKNAGKTTFLNYALNKLRAETPVAYLSVGVDGEKTDAVFGNPKPRITARKGDILVTADSALRASDIDYEILNVYPGRTALGRTLLLKVLREGFVEIVGPENNSRLGEILSDLELHKTGAVLIDGAADRITQVSAHRKASFIYVARIEPENVNSAIDNIKLVHRTARAPAYHYVPDFFGKADGPDRMRYGTALMLKGAVTRTKIAGIDKDVSEIIFEDLTKIFLSYQDWLSLAGKYQLFFARKFELLAFSINLYNISREDFEKRLDDREIIPRILYNPYFRQ